MEKWLIESLGLWMANIESLVQYTYIEGKKNDGLNIKLKKIRMGIDFPPLHFWGFRKFIP